MTNETRHVYPIDDLREHDTQSRYPDCWCDPAIEWHDGGCLIVHNSADGREQRERRSALH